MITLGALTGFSLQPDPTTRPAAHGARVPPPPDRSPAPQVAERLGGPGAPSPASPTPEQDRVPCRKVPYVQFEDALQKKRDLLALGPGCKSPETLVVYHCHNCRHFHVGHDNREKITVPAAGIPRIQL